MKAISGPPTFTLKTCANSAPIDEVRLVAAVAQLLRSIAKAHRRGAREGGDAAAPRAASEQGLTEPTPATADDGPRFETTQAGRMNE